MKTKVAFFCAALMMAMLSAVCRADDSVAMQSIASPLGITVNGHAEVDAKPDVAYASLGVVTQAPAQVDAISQNAEKANAVKQALIKAGVADEDIKTDYYQVQPQYDYRSTPAVLVGYQVSNFFKVTIRNLPKAGVIVDHASQAGANQVNGITYDLSDRDQVEGQALASAVTNARSKADLVAGVAGVSVGRLLNLTETSNEPQQSPGPIFMRAEMAAAVPAAAPTPLRPQDIVITADVTALYAIGYVK
jgi:uncharacterized protein YggE